MNSGGPHLRTVRTGEHQRIDLDAALVSAADRVRLESLGNRILTMDPAGSKLRLGFKAAVGVIVIDAYRIVVEPKFAFDGRRLIEWMCFALDVDPPAEELRRGWNQGSTGFFDLIVTALISECRSLARAGLRRDYLRQRTVESVLRGRLDLGRQIASRYGQIDRLHLETFDRDVRTWENTACGAALRKAARLAVDPDLARQAAELAKDFPRADDLRRVTSALRRGRYTRVNQRYRPAHAWARMLLNDQSIDDLLIDSGAAADAFMVDMNRLWEAVVRRMVAEAAAPRGGALVPIAASDRITVRGDLGDASTFPPDALIGFPDSLQRKPIDAKYKNYADKRVSASDVHQLTTYAQAYAAHESPYAVIVHPSPGRPARRDLTVSGPAGALARIAVIGIDTELDAAQAVKELARVVLPDEAIRAS
jgi:5-methylcytosine-specific restriction enzyme subunit McrC